MTINQRQFALLSAMDITLWCDKSRPTIAIHELSPTTVVTNTASDNVKTENIRQYLGTDEVNVATAVNAQAVIKVQALCKQPFFQDILLCLHATPADVSALSSAGHELSIKIKSLVWQFSSEDQITVKNMQLQSPHLARLRSKPAFKKQLWQQLSQLNLQTNPQ